VLEVVLSIDNLVVIAVLVGKLEIGMEEWLWRSFDDGEPCAALWLRKEPTPCVRFGSQGSFHLASSSTKPATTATPCSSPSNLRSGGHGARRAEHRRAGFIVVTGVI